MRAVRLACRNVRRCSLSTTPVRFSNRTCQSRNSAADISASGCSDQTPFACMPCPSSKVSTRRPPGGRRAYAQACSTPSGSLKPDTELRISLAIFARLPMLRAVAVVPAEVCEVIS